MSKIYQLNSQQLQICKENIYKDKVNKTAALSLKQLFKVTSILVVIFTSECFMYQQLIENL